MGPLNKDRHPSGKLSIGNVVETPDGKGTVIDKVFDTDDGWTYKVKMLNKPREIWYTQDELKGCKK